MGTRVSQAHGNVGKRRTKKQKKNHPFYKNVHAPKGTAWCSWHQQYEPVENFNKSKSRSNGLDNRCREGAKEYRKEHVKKYGKVSETSKIVRVSANVHKLAKKLMEHRNMTLQEVSNAAIKFYAKYGCNYPNCSEPRSAHPTGRCGKHIHSVVITERDQV